MATGKPNTLAVVSLACGIAAFVVLPCAGSLAAIITGHLARGEIRRTGEEGHGLATAGMVLGYLHVVLTICVILFMVLVLGVTSFAALQQGHGH